MTVTPETQPFRSDTESDGDAGWMGDWWWKPSFFRKRRAFQWPITLSALLISLNVALMVCWIVLLARLQSWSALTIGTIFFALILLGMCVYLVLTLKEVRLNQRQANFVDSVTHELKSPISSLKLYLETLQMREMSETQRADFYRVMRAELQRLDELINHLLEVARLDAIGQQEEAEAIELEPLLRKCANTTAAHYLRDPEKVFRFDCDPVIVQARRIAVEMIFSNLLENAIKYSGEEPEVEVEVRNQDPYVLVRIADNGEGVPPHMRKKIFRIFVRGGNELERKQKGTGLGLYIVRTLVYTLKGKIKVTSRPGQPGTVFEVRLPGEGVA